MGNSSFGGALFSLRRSKPVQPSSFFAFGEVFDCLTLRNMRRRGQTKHTHTHKELQMPKTTYIAIDPAGGEHTRKSDRVYTHTVVCRGGYERDLAQANNQSYELKQATKMWA